ncbi:MAG TPA: PadR family transcriptional regulator, partial [Fibrobacteria bacterium]|nr:PadR family transcriptional regulator [Fibrobacteria bacterium]
MDSSDICNAEATLLGLLSEGPRHPYQISLEIHERGMQTWSDLSRTTVYKMLRRLELKRMVKGESEATAGGRKRRVYRPTAKGSAALNGYLRHESSHH